MSGKGATPEPVRESRTGTESHVTSGVNGSGRERGFRLSYLIGRLDRAIQRQMMARLQVHNLSLSQYIVMSVLLNRPGLSNAQLARRSFVSPQAMNEVIAGLEAADLVTREVDQNHRRVLRATITPRGRKILTQLDGEIGELEEEMLASVPAEDRAQFVEVALQCVHALGAGLPDV
jgi:DNA-binding MarR family transcriptional regulator